MTFTNLGAMIRYEIMIDEYDAEGLNFVQNIVQLTETTVDSFGLTDDTEVFAGFAFELSGAEVADDFSINATGQKTCEGMYTQFELYQAVADAVSQSEASKDIFIEEKNQIIAALEESISTLQADVEAKDALLAEKEANINQLKDELDDHQCRHPHNNGKRKHYDKNKRKHSDK